MTKKTCKDLEVNGTCKLWTKCQYRNKCGADPISTPLNLKTFRKGSKLAYQEGRHWNNRGGLNK